MYDLVVRAVSCLTWRSTRYRASAAQQTDDGDVGVASLFNRWASDDEADAVALQKLERLIPSRMHLRDIIEAVRDASPKEPWQAKHLVAVENLLRALMERT